MVKRASNLGLQQDGQQRECLSFWGYACSVSAVCASSMQVLLVKLVVPLQKEKGCGEGL